MRELGRGEPVDADTLFLIASNGKALATLLLAREVDRGLFTWNTPATQVYPAFELGDPEATRRVQMKHLVCACTGMPRQDLEWLFEFKGATPERVLMIDRRSGVAVVHHPGSMVGYQSLVFWVPDAGVGGVLLANAYAGAVLREPLVRRVLEVLYDGRPEAEEDVKSAVARRKSIMASERARLALPAEPAVAGRLAARYRSGDGLGDLAVAKRGRDTVLDSGEWQTAVASLKNEDGTYSLVAADPGLGEYEFVLAERAAASARSAPATRSTSTCSSSGSGRAPAPRAKATSGGAADGARSPP